MTPRVKRLIALLESIEFIDTDRGFQCPSCGEGHYKNPDKNIHAPSCELASLLKSYLEDPVAVFCPDCGSGHSSWCVRYPGHSPELAAAQQEASYRGIQRARQKGKKEDL